jgi:hypothetical protein
VQASDSGVRQLAERRAIDEQHRRQVAYAVCQLLLGDTAAAADTLGLSAGSPVKCERSMLAFVKVRRAASFCVYRTAATACGSVLCMHKECVVCHLMDAAVGCCGLERKLLLLLLPLLLHWPVFLVPTLARSLSSLPPSACPFLLLQANCPDPSDPLPGLCVLAQRWVADVALGSFRGTQGATFSLEGWFELGPVRCVTVG